ncbi:hypothetical protein BLOT_002085 [Blomia tropicalis]|nr:hypothetical protein BLOT_002085 [Blomia tropicalis]
MTVESTILLSRETFEYKCLNQTDCPEKSICFESLCRCPFGFRLNEIGQCIAVSCFLSADCSFYFAHSHCNFIKGRCFCNLGYKIDHQSQSCTFDNNDYYDHGSSSGRMWTTIITLFLLMLALMFSCLLCQNNKPQIVSIPEEHTNVRIRSLRQPHFSGVHVPPPPEYARNYSHEPKYLPPPPYTP